MTENGFYDIYARRDPGAGHTPPSVKFPTSIQLDLAVFSETNFWALFGGRKVTIISIGD